jgi:hypothetical protein
MGGVGYVSYGAIMIDWQNQGPYGPVMNQWGHFARLLMERASLPGEIAEFGVYNGGSTRQLAQFGRTVWAFDTYAGMPAEDTDTIRWDECNPAGKFRPELTIEEMFEGYPNIIPVKGRFMETFPHVPKNVRFCFAYLDADQYASCGQVLEFLRCRMVPGGAVLVDDSTLLGVKTALAEFKTKNPVLDWMLVY